MTEELPSSTPYFQRKFQEWFRELVPADPSISIEADLSIGNHDPVILSFPAEAQHFYYQTRRSRYDWLKLFELIGFGFAGAIALGAGVVFIILIMNSSLGWYGINWPDQSIFIFLAVAIGFGGGMFKRSIEMVHEKYSNKDKL